MKPILYLYEPLEGEPRKELEKYYILDDMSEYNKNTSALYVRLRPFKMKDHKHFPKLTHIICPCTGTDHIDIPPCCELISLDDKDWLEQNVFATAELTFALILSLARKIITGHVGITEENNWNRYRCTGTELRGKTLGILGYGRVGRQVDRIAQGFGLTVKTADKNQPNDRASVFDYSDFVSIHLPLNKETRNSIGAIELSLMKKSAFLINTSRAEIVNAKWLIHALYNKLIAGAAIDTLEGYSEGERNDLTCFARAYDNLILTPHIGGNTVESRLKTDLFVVEKLIKMIKPRLYR